MGLRVENAPARATPHAVAPPGATTITFRMRAIDGNAVARVRYRIDPSDRIAFSSPGGEPRKVAWKVPVEVGSDAWYEVDKTVLLVRHPDGAPRFVGLLLIRIDIQEMDEEGNDVGATIHRRARVRISQG